MAENTTTPAPAPAPQAQQQPQGFQQGGPRGPQGRGGRGGGQGGQRGRRPELAPEEKQFDERVVHIDRVARVVKGGRRFRFRALVVVGDRKNRVGIGIAKGADVTAAVTKATEVAKKHFITVNLKDGTIAHEAETKVSGARILIKPAAKGTGLIAGGVVRTILEVAGVHNILSKSLGSSNKANVAYATIEALRQIVPVEKWITTKDKPAAAEKKAAAKVKAETKDSKEEPKEPAKESK
jgi:small subunit ribosomal protein S5